MKRVIFSFAAVLASVVAFAAEKASVYVRPDRLNCVYAAGETARLTVTAEGANGAKLKRGTLTVNVDNFGARQILTRTVDLAKENPFKLEVTRKAPGFVRLGVTSKDLEVVNNAGQGKGTYYYGVAFSPREIQPGTPNPADFDAFWANAIRTLDETVPVDAKMTLMPEKSKGACNVYQISFASYGGRRVYGWLSEPKDLSKGPFPVRLSVPGAGIGALGVGSSDNVIHCMMNVHSYAQPEVAGDYSAPERQKAYQDQDEKYAKPCGVKRYCQAGIHKSREDYFYYASILGINRAFNWVAQRPGVDPANVTYSGTSQGGGFGLMMTALNKNITRSCIFVPAITDLMGYRQEDRQSGWPRLIEEQLPENRAAAEKWAPYFCGVNFARRITCPIRFVAGFGDVVCTPNGVYSAFNVCPSADKEILNGIGMGHGVFADFYDYLRAWEMAKPGEKSPYRFLSFNIWGDYFGNPTQERDAIQVGVIRKWNPDFVAYQEVTANFWRSKLFTELSDTYEYVGKGFGLKGGDSFTPIGYRRDRFERLASGGEVFCPELDGSKGVSWVVVKDRASGKRLVAFASHFWWRYDGVGDDYVRLDNARRLYAAVSAAAKKYDAAIIGGGDLNAPLESWGMKSLLSSGLVDAQRSAPLSARNFGTEHGNPERDALRVYVGTPGVRGINRVAPKFQILDHIFYDPKRITVDRFDLDISKEACGASDHHPIVADFRLK